ncbi:MAG: flavodoxin family protein [Christensenellales bacterium]|jgi:multimeric flavodoxin WrbA
MIDLARIFGGGGKSMKIAIITASPNPAGLTAACADAAAQGVKQAGGQIVRISLNEVPRVPCQGCKNGWGACRDEGRCALDEDFNRVAGCLAEVDGLALVTPVYWGECAEPMKAFLDRLRRCDAQKKEQGRLFGKPALLVAAAGGTGNGALTTLEQMQRFCQHVGAKDFDRIGVTRRSKAYMIPAIAQAAAAMTQTCQQEEKHQ